MNLKLSPDAANDLIDAVENGLSMFSFESDDLEGATDCPEGCTIEPDAYCRHGYLSASETMLRLVA